MEQHGYEKYKAVLASVGGYLPAARLLMQSDRSREMLVGLFLKYLLAIGVGAVLGGEACVLHLVRGHATLVGMLSQQLNLAGQGR